MSDLKPGESGLREVRRILVEWVAAAVRILGRKRVSDANIHDARKQLKKARAALRLLRGSIGEIAYRRENVALRDAARPLGAARDSRVLVAAMNELVKHRQSKQPELDKFRRLLRQERTRTRRALSRTLISKQRTQLRAVTKRSDRWRLHGDDWNVIVDGLRRSYRRSRKGMRAAKESRDTEQLHDWRKQVKYLWHQLQILEPVRSARITGLANRCHKLAELLGDDHDLAVLRNKIECQDTHDLDELRHLLDHRRVQLQDEAFALGARLFADQPRVFAQRIGKHLQAWRDSATE